MNKIEAFETALLNLKEDIDRMEDEVLSCNDALKVHKPYVQKFNDLKQQRAEIVKRKRAKEALLRELKSFYETATGGFPDGIFPLFNKTNNQQIQTPAQVN